MKEVLKNYLETIQSKLWDISDKLYDHPELGDQEYESMKLLVEFLEGHHFTVEKGIVDRPTALSCL